MNLKKILIVDDEEDILNLLKIHLAKRGYEIFTTTEPEEVIEILDKDKIHIVILDIMMPGITGIELLEQIKKHNPLVQVIMMSAFSNLLRVTNCLTKGANDFITKPFLDVDMIIKEIIQETVDKLERWNNILQKTFKIELGKKS